MSKQKKPDLITGEDEAKLKELIKKLIKQELQDLDETSTTSGTGGTGGTGGIDGFSTPFAFSKKGGTNNATKATLKQNPGSKLAEKEEELDEKKVVKKKNKNKKPDADGDGVPNWADKHPGEPDQNFEKKAKKKAVWKKGVEKLQKDLDSLDENEKKLNEAVSRYARLKEHPKTHSYKVSVITQEITKMLREVDFLMIVNHKLKTEMEVPNETLWKRTSDRMAEIKARLKSISEKLRKIQ
jgi:hypothetical protein